MGKKTFSFLLIIIAIILAYYTARYFGYMYNLFPQSPGGPWIGSESAWDSLIGLPLALIFFLTLLSYTWIFKSKKSVLWLISPLILLEIGIDLNHIYIPILLIVVAFLLNKCIRLITSKFKHPNPPMVIK